jgi:hypothetical protein
MESRFAHPKEDFPMLSTLRNLTAVGAALGTMLVATGAQAQDRGHFGEQGQFIFSADRLFPIISYSSATETDTTVNPNISYNYNATSLGLFGGFTSFGTPTGGPVAVGFGSPSFYTVPRLGFDYTIIPNLTIGGDLIVWTTVGGSGTQSQGGRSASVSAPNGNVFGLAPRVGYIFGMSDLLSIWLRGGLSFYTANQNQPGACSTNNDSEGIYVLGLDLDPQLVISPVNHLAFTAGPALDWGFAGSAYQSTYANGCNTKNSPSYGYNALDFSINGGLLGWF